MARIFHVLNRGVDKRSIFLDDQDRYRFIHDMFEFNDRNSSNNNLYFFKKTSESQYMDLRSPYIGKRIKSPRILLVDIYAFCIMDNHYHLMLSPRSENALSFFMKKLNLGYAKYFNEKYKRSGALFQGRFKRVQIEHESHFVHLPYYIHFNPLDISYPEWRDRNLKSFPNAIEFLNSYRWSSHLDYCGVKNFPSITQRELVLEFFGGTDAYKKASTEWLRDLNLETLEKITLE